MTATQKAIVRELLRLSIDHGFGSRYLLAPIAEKLGITEPLYDNNTNAGALWEIGPHGKGYLDIGPDGKSAAIDYDQHELLKHWSGFRGF